MESGTPPPGGWLPPRPPGDEPEVAPKPEAPVSYGGPVPPGGWQHEQPSKSDAWGGAPLAGWWSRVGAAVLDGLILLIPVGVLVGIGLALALDGAGAAEVIGWIVVGLGYVGALALYSPLLMMRSGAHNGQTWGRQIMGIRVVRDSGVEMGFGYAFVREVIVKWLLFQAIGGTFFIPTLLDWLWPLWDGENRALHDFVCSSHVVKA